MQPVKAYLYIYEIARRALNKFWSSFSNFYFSVFTSDIECVCIGQWIRCQIELYNDYFFRFQRVQSPLAAKSKKTKIFDSTISISFGVSDGWWIRKVWRVGRTLSTHLDKKFESIHLFIYLLIWTSKTGDLVLRYIFLLHYVRANSNKRCLVLLTIAKILSVRFEIFHRSQVVWEAFFVMSFPLALFVHFINLLKWKRDPCCISIIDNCGVNGSTATTNTAEIIKIRMYVEK